MAKHSSRVVVLNVVNQLTKFVRAVKRGSVNGVEYVQVNCTDGYVTLSDNGGLKAVVKRREDAEDDRQESTYHGRMPTGNWKLAFNRESARAFLADYLSELEVGD